MNIVHFSRLFRNLKFCALIALILSGASRVYAADVIEMVATAGTVTRTIGSSSIPNVVEDFIQKQNQFSSFSGANFVNGNLRVFGIDRVLSIGYSDNSGAGGPVSAFLSSSVAPDVQRSFSGATRDELNQQIKDYLKNEGSADLAKILAALNRSSPASAIQGNPSSSASLTAQNTFDQYGFPDALTRSEKKEGAGKGINSRGLGFSAEVGLADANGYKQQSYSLPLYFPIYTSKNERWGVRLDMPLNYTKIEGAEIYRVGMTLAVPIVIIGTLDQETPWHWQVTPSGGSQATASFDLVTGGVLNNGGLTSSLEYDLGPKCYDITLAMGNQFTAIESMEVGIGSYSFDPDVSTQIIKNGLKVSLPLGQHWAVDVYGIDTRLLGANNFNSHYETVGGSLGWRSSSGKGYYKVGIYSNIAHQFSSQNFQLGAGWKF